MIIVAGFLLAVASVPLSGKRLTDIADVRFRALPLIAATLLGQILLINVFPEQLGGKTGALLHLATYAGAFVFLWLNQTVPWLWLVVAGGLMNLTAIAANGGAMPASRWALEMAGQDAHSVEKFTNSGLTDGRLLPLGDILAWPEPLPLANVFSIGDVLLVVGVAMVLHRHCHRRRPAEQAPAP